MHTPNNSLVRLVFSKCMSSGAFLASHSHRWFINDQMLILLHIHKGLGSEAGGEVLYLYVRVPRLYRRLDHRAMRW